MILKDVEEIKLSVKDAQIVLRALGEMKAREVYDTISRIAVQLAPTPETTPEHVKVESDPKLTVLSNATP